MKELFTYLLQSSICLGVFLLIYLLFLRGKTFFTFNRIFLLLGLVVSLVIPIIKISYNVAIPSPTAISYTEDVESFVSNSKETEFAFLQILPIVYFLGIICMLIRNISTYKMLIQLKKEGQIEQYGNFHLINNAKVKTPFSVFKSIYLCKNKLQEKENEIILKHEISHITQNHWIDLLCNECALTLQWFNPLMWYYTYLLKENHEYLADEAVLNDGESIFIYQAVLLNQRFQGPVFSFSNSFNYSNHQKRLTMMKKTKTSPWKKISAMAVLPFVGAFFMLNAKPNYIYKEVSNEMTINDSSNIINKEDVTIIGWGHKSPIQLNSLDLDTKTQPLILLDGKEVPNIENINADDISRISVIKDKSGAKVYGAKAKNGVILITTKKEEDKSLAQIKGLDLKNPPLVLLDGEEVPNTENINTDDISSIAVLKDKSAIEEYGDKGKNGVILITTKNKN